MNQPFLLLGVVFGVSSYAWGCAQLRNSSISVSEAEGTAQVCVVFTESVTESGQLTIASSNDGEATSPDDFVAVDTTLDVPMNFAEEMCINIAINVDNRFEDMEFFTVNLISSTVQLCPTMNSGTVFIIDSTRLPVRFTESIYRSSNENGIEDVCLSVPNTFEYDRGVSFNLEVITDGATAGPDDFTFSATNLVINVTSQMLFCQPVLISPDTVVENDEFFGITLTSGDSIDLVGGNTRVVITDDDGAMLSLVEMSNEVVEGNSGNTSVDFCVRLDSDLELDRDVVLLLNTEPLTATFGDYRELVDETLTVPARSVQLFETCASVFIFGDTIRETDEVFTVEKAPQNDNDIITTVSFRVTILDDGDTDPPVCITLSDPPNGRITLTGTSPGDNATYACNEGFFTDDATIRMCTVNAMWTGQEPICEVVMCGQLDPPANGTLNISGFTFSSEAVYMCDIGFSLSTGGNTFTRMCQNNAAWSGAEPTCGRTSSDSGDNTGAIVGGIIGALLVLSIIICLGICGVALLTNKLWKQPRTRSIVNVDEGGHGRVHGGGFIDTNANISYAISLPHQVPPPLTHAPAAVAKTPL